METWWVNQKHLYPMGGPPTAMSAAFERHIMVVKLADVEALERRVKWLEKGQILLAKYTKHADMFSAYFPSLPGKVRKWLAAEPPKEG